MEKVTNKYVLYKSAVISCWVILAICFILKLLNSNLFLVVVENDLIIKICNYIDNSWLFYVLLLINHILSGFMYFIAIIGTTKIKVLHIFLVILCLIFTFFIKFYSSIVEFCLFFVLFAFIFLKIYGYSTKETIFRTLKGVFLMLSFRVANRLIKNITIYNGILMHFLYSIDYFFILTLYVFYSLHKNKWRFEK